MTATRQSTLDDLQALQYIKNLNQRQINIIRFLEKGYYQADIARRLNCDRSLVNRTVKKLEEYNLIIPEKIYIQLNNKEIFKEEELGKIKTIAKADPWHSRATTYIVTNRLKNLLNQLPSLSILNPKGEYVLGKPHFFKMKYPVLSQNGEINTEGWKSSRSKTTYSHSWNPHGKKGVMRHRFDVETPNGTIGIEYHHTSLIAYRVDRTAIMARSIPEAKQVVSSFIQEGVSIFIHEQNRDGNCTLHLGQPNQTTKDLHWAFESELAKQLIKEGKEVNVPGLNSLRIDDSPKKKGLANGDKFSEIELNEEEGTIVDIALRKALYLDQKIDALDIDRKIDSTLAETFAPVADLPKTMELLSDRISEMTTAQNQTRVDMRALVEGGTTAQFQVNQLTGVMGRMLELINNHDTEMKTLKDEIRVLRKDRDKENQKKLDLIIKKLGIEHESEKG